MGAKRNDRTTAYARRIVSGKIRAGELVRLACQRHLDDLKHAHNRGLFFDVEEAEYRISFAQFVKHYKGEWAGCVFEPEPWQCFIIGSLFGWKHTATGLRRFKISYTEIAKKNGKTFMAAFVGLLLFYVDQEPGAEVYTAATKKEQAKLSHDDATRMVKGSPALRKKIGIYRDNLHIESNASKFEPLSADANTLDGPNVHGAIIDELHAHKSGDLWDVLTAGVASRRQPLTFAITTAGQERVSICRQQRDYSEGVLRGRYRDDSHFAYIAAMDEGDDWRHKKNWIKANPNLGVSVKKDYLEQRMKKAAHVPSEQNNLLRLHFNVWTKQQTRWLDMNHWAECGGLINEHKLKGIMGYGGLDLSQKIDLSAFLLTFPLNGGVTALPYFWLPEESVIAVQEPWRQWIKAGYIKATPGAVVDFDFIEADIVKLRKRFLFEQIAYDPWTATQTATNLQEDHGFVMVETRQGFRTLSEPSKELERLVTAHLYNHGGHPVLTHMADGVAIRSDEMGNIKPVKDKSTVRIDGIIAGIMSLSLLVRHQDTQSIYETRGML